MRDMVYILLAVAQCGFYIVLHKCATEKGSPTESARERRQDFLP